MINKKIDHIAVDPICNMIDVNREREKLISHPDEGRGRDSSCGKTKRRGQTAGFSDTEENSPLRELEEENEGEELSEVQSYSREFPPRQYQIQTERVSCLD